jgi:hypothetical protein
LGISNSIAVDYVTIGRGDANDLVKFNPAFTNQNPSIFINGTNGSSSLVGVYVVGDDSPGAGGSSTATNDFTGGTVNLQANYLCVGRGREGANDTGSSSGVLMFNNGGISANVLAVGFLYPSGSNSVANGTVNINGGTLMVISNITLAAKPNVGSGTTSGTLNVNGGLVQATNISGGGGTAIISLNSGTLDFQPDWATAQGVITNISTLNVGANGNNNFALLTDAAQVATMNTLTIASNGIISGNTVFISPNLAVNGTLSPGSGGAGAMTNTGMVSLGAGGHFIVTVDDAVAGAGLGWSFLQTTGINVQSTVGNPFVIDLQTVDNPADNFNANSNYDWTIAAAGGITNFSADRFVIHSTFFQNNLAGGNFYLHTNGNSLVLSFTNRPVVPIAINSQFSIPNSQLILSGGGGNAGAPYIVLASTNLALPVAQWTVLATNYFDTNGDFNFTNSPDSNLPQTFYLLKLQ